MIGRRYGRRGVMLTVVVAVMIVVGGLLTVLAANAAGFYRQHQVNRARAAAQALADSAAAYVRAHGEEIAVASPAQPIPLDVSALLAPSIHGSATVGVRQTAGGRICHITARAGWHQYEVENEIELPLPPATTRPG